MRFARCPHEAVNFSACAAKWTHLPLMLPCAIARDICERAMAQSPFFPRHVPQQTADASKERMPLVLNLSAQGNRQRSFIQHGCRLSTRRRPYRLFATTGTPAQSFPAVGFQPVPRTPVASRPPHGQCGAVRQLTKTGPLARCGTQLALRFAGASRCRSPVVDHRWTAGLSSAKEKPPR